MSYRSIHSKLEQFELWLMWLLVAAFFLAVALMFLHATLAMLMVWLGLFVLAGAFVIVRIMRRAEVKAAKAELEGHHCPKCGAEVSHPDAGNADWECASCGAAFTSQGLEAVPG